MLGEKIEIGAGAPNLKLEIYKGHYATSHNHTSYYIDVTKNKSELAQAKAVAAKLAEHYINNVMVDTVLCIDGTEVIGACLAEELTSSHYASMNAGRNINILTPEYNAGNQIFFRDNTVPMITGKFVLVLAASVDTGVTAKSAVGSVTYYGGRAVGIASIFATIDECDGIPVTSIFDMQDLPGYATYAPNECPMCKKGEKLNALVNSHGCSQL